MKTKRLFLFAGYDVQGIVDDTLVHYLRCLSDYGDIVFVMDNDASKSELNKVTNIPHVLYAVAARHGEYDFGSYKRAYGWADKNGLLNKYDWVYLVNDSVYGPLYDIRPILDDLESRGVDMTGMIAFSNKYIPVHIQSWFVGLSRRVATSDFMRDFMKNVCAQQHKHLIVLKYEVGLSQTVLHHGYKMSTYMHNTDGDKCHYMYDNPLKILKQGMPFIKRMGLHNLGELQYLYPYTTESFIDAISKHAARCGIKFAAPQYKRPPYTKSYRLTLLSIPLVTIYRQRHNNEQLTCYKIFLFDFIPVAKIMSQK